jgi:4-amino-4-deoxychorismate lyase
MSLLFETIRIENGIIMHPGEHEKRMFDSRVALFGLNDHLRLSEVISIPVEFGTGIVRCRVDYGKDIEDVKFTKYKLKPLKRFRIIINDKIKYPFKFSDRSELEFLFPENTDVDEIIIVKNGMITDTSISNLIFLDGNCWITPARPLLKGTCRERMIREGKVKEQYISLRDIGSFSGFKVINAMIWPEEMAVIPIDAIIQT